MEREVGKDINDQSEKDKLTWDFDSNHVNTEKYLNELQKKVRKKS